MFEFKRVSSRYRGRNEIIGEPEKSQILIARLLRARDQSIERVSDSRVIDDVIKLGLAGLVLEDATRHGFRFAVRENRRLQAAAAAVKANNDHQMRQLEQTVAVLDQAGIPVLLLKGAALLHTAYDRLDARPMTDVDILVHPGHAGAAVTALLDRGFRRGVDLVSAGFFPKFYYETELFTDSDPRVRIDLHARPFRPLRYARIIPEDALWHHARVCSLGRAIAYVPEPETMWVHLAAHAAFHGCARIIWLYDLVRVADRSGSDFNWPKVVALAKQWHLSAAIHHALRRASELFGSIAPWWVRDELASCKTSWRDRWTLAQGPRDVGHPITHVLCNLLCTPGLRFRFEYARSVLLPSRRHLRSVYPFRHFGWPLPATLWRFLRILVRPIMRGFRSPRQGRSDGHAQGSTDFAFRGSTRPMAGI
jgi:hypothetical protein